MYAALIGFILGLLTRAKSNDLKRAEDNHEATDADKGDNQSIVPVRVQIGFSDEDKKEYRTYQEQHYALQKSLKRAAWLTFWAVFVYAAITLGMYYANKKAANAARDAANEAEQSLKASIEQFHLDQRAWVGVTETNFKLAVGQPGQFVIVVVNSGKTPAIHVRALVEGRTVIAGHKITFQHNALKKGLDSDTVI